MSGVRVLFRGKRGREEKETPDERAVERLQPFFNSIDEIKRSQHALLFLLFLSLEGIGESVKEHFPG